MQHFYLMRHGDTDCKRRRVFQSDNTPLSELGIDNVLSSCGKLSSKITIIITSPLARAVETTEIINKKLNVPIIVNPRLKEISNPKAIHGKSYDNPKANSTYVDWVSNLRNSASLGVKDQENYRDLYDRVSKVLEDLKNTPHNNVLIVSHSVTIRSIVAFILEDGLFSENYINTIQNTKLPNCSVVKIIHNKGKWSVSLES